MILVIATLFTLFRGTEKTEQCFPFGLTPANLLALEELLTSELQSVYTDVQVRRVTLSSTD